MDKEIPRRRLLQVWSGVVAYTFVGSRFPRSGRAEAQAKATREQVKYQDTPKGKQECSNCLHFIAPDQCKLVAGKINPKGWCMLYAPKPPK